MDPGQYRVYPDAAATLALCAYKGYQNYMLAEGFPRLTGLLPKLHLEALLSRNRVVSGRVELAGSATGRACTAGRNWPLTFPA